MLSFESLEKRMCLNAATLAASVDAYVRAGSYASKNFGGATFIEVKQLADANYVRYGYLKFDLAGVTSAAIAKLRVYGGTSGGTVSISAFRTSSNWSENSITFNNRPATTGSALGAVNVGQTKQWFEVDVTAAVKDALSAKQTTVSVALAGTVQTLSQVTLNSSEATANRPQLVIDAGSTTNPPPPTNPPPASTAKPISWSTKAPNPLTREETVAFDYGGWLYSIGGYYNNNFTATTRVDRYNPATNVWQTRKNAPTKITHAGTAVDTQKGLVWMVGGFIGNFPNPQGTNKVWKYNPNSDSWTAGPNLPVARAAGGAAIVGRTLYFFGGSNATRSSDQSEGWKLNLDATNPQWQSIAKMPVGRNHFGYAAVNGKIYVIGGQKGLEEKASYLSSVVVYNPSTNAWGYGPSLPEPISHFLASTDVYKGRYILTGGGDRPHNVAQNDVFMLDTANNKWSRLTGLPSPRRATSGAIIGDKFVISGGWYNHAQRRETYVADLSVLNLA